VATDKGTVQFFPPSFRWPFMTVLMANGQTSALKILISFDWQFNAGILFLQKVQSTCQ
jgi:hypothetical protein